MIVEADELVMKVLRQLKGIAATDVNVHNTKTTPLAGGGNGNGQGKRGKTGQVDAAADPHASAAAANRGTLSSNAKGCPWPGSSGRKLGQRAA